MEHVNLTITVHEDKETGEYVVRCVELGISTMVTDVDQALPMIAEATMMYLNTLEEAGERARVFEERGIQTVPGRPQGEGEVRARVRQGDFVSHLSVPVSAA